VSARFPHLPTLPPGISDLIPNLNMMLNCANDTEAIPLTDQEALDSLSSFCPDLVAEIRGEFGGEVRTCCDASQIINLEAQLQWLSAIIGRCPACQANIFNTFCYLTCHPHNSEFLVPTSYEERPEGTAVGSVDEYMNDVVVTEIFDSCDEVYYPDLSIPAMSILCGAKGSHCTPHDLYDYFGNNFMTPFPIKYYYTNDTTVDLNDTFTVTPYKVHTHECGDHSVENMFCLCADCRDSCVPVDIEPVSVHVPVMVGSVELLAFVLILVFAIELIVVVIAYVRSRGKSEKSMTKSSSREKDSEKMMLEDVREPHLNEKWSAELDDFFARFFTKTAKVVIGSPVLVVVASLVVYGVLIAGLTHLKLTTDPVRLWASPTSRTRLEKEVFDTQFRPFYRTTQVIIRAPPGMTEYNYTEDSLLDPQTYTLGPAFNVDLVLGLMDLVNDIMQLTAEYENQTVTMEDVCNRPLYPTSNTCTFMSVTEYWQNNKTNLLNSIKEGTYNQTMVDCVSNPANIDTTQTYCLGASGIPVLPYTALGGFLPEGAQSSLTDATSEYFAATALLVTMPLDNYNDKSLLGPVMAWEARFLEFMKEYQEENKDTVDFAYNAERGIEDEIQRSSMGDVSIIAVSYLLMFLYITVALGNFSADCRQMMLESKVVVGASGVLLVLVAVFASMGMYGWAGVEATLFCIEVVPFLVLAVGVDNIFIIVQTYQRETPLKGESTADFIARVVGKAAPTLLFSTTSEAVCFFLGAMSDMPAVYSFCLYAGMALVLNFILQITCFVPILYADARRVESNRYDVFCCIQGSKTPKYGNMCYNFMRDVYAKVLLKKPVKVFVVLLFSASLFVNASLIPKMDVGLEQDLSMPDDSYVKKYFEFLNKYLSIGAPVYLVVTDGYNFSDINAQNAICSGNGCNEDSMLSRVFSASMATDLTLVASGSNSWIENYLSWITDDSKVIEACCRLDKNGTFIGSSAEKDKDAVELCLNMTTDTTLDGSRPLPELFMDWVPYFLQDNPHGTKCPQAGHPAFGDAVVVNTDDAGAPLSIGHSHFMAYHTILRTSQDFTDALEQIYKLTDDYTEYLQNVTGTKATVFPYSIFYVYYEQYLTMWHSTVVTLLTSLGAVFIVLLVLSGFSVWASLITLVLITMILVNMMGMMVWWNIQLNAVTLVNLVMAIGISVEFCSHIVHAFATSLLPSRDERAVEALATMGASVFSGITLTKFVGIVVLAFAQSPIFQVFYFRMYLGMVVFGGAHSLLLLPVMLSVAGPGVNCYLLKKEILRRGKTKVTEDTITTENL